MKVEGVEGFILHLSGSLRLWSMIGVASGNASVLCFDVWIHIPYYCSAQAISCSLHTLVFLLRLVRCISLSSSNARRRIFDLFVGFKHIPPGLEHKSFRKK